MKLRRRVERRLRLLFRNLGISRYFIQEKIARNRSTIAYLFGLLFFYLAIAFLIPLAVALFYEEDPRPWIYPLLLTASLGIPLLLRYQPSEMTRPTETMFVVTNAWLMAMVFGAIPYMMYGMGVVDAMFETMSGFTTTGATIMTEIEAWPKSLLFWRSFTQWLGGAGIVMIFITIFPMLGVAGRSLARNECVGMDIQNIPRRIQDESKKFHYIFLGLSAAQFLLLLLTGIGIYDSLVVMFSTLSTGGFSPHTASIAFYQSRAVEWIVIAFMFLAGTNFYLHFQALRARDWRIYWKSREFRAYLTLFVSASVVGAILLWGDTFTGLGESLTASTFQALSLMTSTGFATTDFALWSGSILFILFLLMIIGGCSGSTAGGLKVVRFVLLRKFIYASLYKTVHPRAIFALKLDGRNVTENAFSSVMAVVICYLATTVAAMMALVLLGIDPLTAMSAAISTVSNTGPALGQLGPMGTYGGLPELAKIILTFTMWAGRLEFLTVLSLLTPVFWHELLRYRKQDGVDGRPQK
ncbi:MAG: TrkH family potassium uptake protein [Euryarchaeota archaeon]|nr:TrkH family potassium uptake protein [Euryarchaeota archaeon]